MVLDQSGQALDPIAVVTVEHPVDLTHLGVVDMATDHAMQPAPTRLTRHGSFEIGDIADCALDLYLR